MSSWPSGSGTALSDLLPKPVVCMVRTPRAGGDPRDLAALVECQPYTWLVGDIVLRLGPCMLKQCSHLKLESRRQVVSVLPGRRLRLWRDVVNTVKPFVIKLSYLFGTSLGD